MSGSCSVPPSGSTTRTRRCRPARARRPPPDAGCSRSGALTVRSRPAIYSPAFPKMPSRLASWCSPRGSAPALDGEALPTDPAELRKAVLSAPAVGRISPEGKRTVIDALSDGGRYVGMVGDGVNDVEALKGSRLAIAQ